MQTDLELLKATYEKLGIQYHEVKSEGGYTYIRKMYAHEKSGFIRVGFTQVPLVRAEQLGEFYEFDPQGKLASW